MSLRNQRRSNVIVLRLALRLDCHDTKGLAVPLERIICSLRRIIFHHLSKRLHYARHTDFFVSKHGIIPISTFIRTFILHNISQVFLF